MGRLGRDWGGGKVFNGLIILGGMEQQEYLIKLQMFEVAGLNNPLICYSGVQ